uniref:Uncharacterized protein n=1 Tax=Arundo donax TaxID=35708 RepID=A0A0A9EMU2_ARUDO
MDLRPTAPLERGRTQRRRRARPLLDGRPGL